MYYNHSQVVLYFIHTSLSHAVCLELFKNLFHKDAAFYEYILDVFYSCFHKYMESFFVHTFQHNLYLLESSKLLVAR